MSEAVDDEMTDGPVSLPFGERRRGGRRRSDRPMLDAEPTGLPGDERLWHVTVTVAGPGTELEEVRAGLERLCNDHPFLMSGRYAADRAEVRYWEEAQDVHDALAMSLRLWGEHRSTAGLPNWSIVGLEVLDRDTYRKRGGTPALLSPGVRPF